jgi:ABC-type glycerol-3-phosphate transport system substrate-binding protein
MKKVLTILLIVFVSWLGAACVKTSNTLQIALDIEDEGRYDELFAYFTAETGIEIRATYGEDISKLIGTDKEPDIIKTSTVVVGSMLPTLLDLTDLIEADPDVDPGQYIDVLIEALTIDGKIYALPTSINTSLLYYNKTLFDESAEAIRLALGLAETDSVYPQSDWTYDDYVKAGVALSRYTTQPDDKRVYTRFGAETQLQWWGEWLVYLNQMGGSFYQNGTNEQVVNLTSAEAIQATTFYRTKSMGGPTEKFAPDATEAASGFSFQSGTCAMIFGGHMGDWYSYDVLGLNWDIQVLPKPVGRPDARGGEIAADAFGISVRSRQPEKAFEFLKLWAGEAGAKEMFKQGKVGALKAMASIIESLPEEDQPSINMAALFEAIDEAVTLPKERDFSKVMREMVMTELYRLMYAGRGSETDVTKVLTTIKTQVDTYYANRP